MDGQPAPTTVARWRATLRNHQSVDGHCPECGTKGRCRMRGEAYGELLAHDLFTPLTPPHTDVRPQPAAGEGKAETHD